MASSWGTTRRCGGNAVVDDFVILGGNAAIHQFGRVGKYAFIGGGAPVVGDVIPFGMVDNHGRLHGLNLVGLKRRGFQRETINALRSMYRELFHGDGQFDDRFAQASKTYAGTPEVMMIIDFINAGPEAGALPAGAGLMARLGLIAGGGDLPRKLAEHVRVQRPRRVRARAEGLCRSRACRTSSTAPRRRWARSARGSG